LAKATCSVHFCSNIVRDVRSRWANMPEPDPAMLIGKLLFVATDLPVARFQMATSLYNANTIAELSRTRGPSVAAGRPRAVEARHLVGGAADPSAGRAVIGAVAEHRQHGEVVVWNLAELTAVAIADAIDLEN
jgi:hypothetical protein